RVHVRVETYMELLAAALRADGKLDLLEELGAVHADDLYLACACAHGDPAALAAFERNFMADVDDYLHRRGSSPGVRDEVAQIVRTRLLVAGDGQPSKIASYNGRRPLKAWLRLTAGRVVIDLARARARQRTASADVDAMATAAQDPELTYLRSRYRGE